MGLGPKIEEEFNAWAQARPGAGRGHSRNAPLGGQAVEGTPSLHRRLGWVVCLMEVGQNLPVDPRKGLDSPDWHASAGGGLRRKRLAGLRR